MSVSSETLGRFVVDLYDEFPGLSIKVKKPWWLVAASKLPLINKTKLLDATQAIGKTVYLSQRWNEFSNETKYRILRHERIHLLQFRKYGVFLMALAYLFVFFPVGLAYCRARIEREAFQESLRAMLEIHDDSDWTLEWAKSLYLKAFVSSKYLFAWPFRGNVLEWLKKDYKDAATYGISQKRCSDKGSSSSQS